MFQVVKTDMLVNQLAFIYLSQSRTVTAVCDLRSATPQLFLTVYLNPMQMATRLLHNNHTSPVMKQTLDYQGAFLPPICLFFNGKLDFFKCTAVQTLLCGIETDAII